jgi:hypothetical protein
MSAHFETAKGATKTMLPSFEDASPNYTGTNADGSLWLDDRPFNNMVPGNSAKVKGSGVEWTIDDCAVLQDPTAGGPKDTMLGCVEFTWNDEWGNAVLAVSCAKGYEKFNTIYETPPPGVSNPVGNAIFSISAKKPGSVFRAALKAWNPNLTVVNGS